MFLGLRFLNIIICIINIIIYIIIKSINIKIIIICVINIIIFIIIKMINIRNNIICVINIVAGARRRGEYSTFFKKKEVYMVYIFIYVANTRDKKI